MAIRQIQLQSIHDKVINIAKNYLNQTDYDIYQNPGSTKNAGVGENYPDIILTKKGTTTIEFFIEVETADSINIKEATNQWLKYANEINATFYILVPVTSRTITLNLCKEIGINARIGLYHQDAFGNITNIIFE